MKSLRTNSVRLLFVVLILLSLRPLFGADQVLNWLFLPTRAVAELGAPLRWVETARFKRSDAALAERRQEEGFAGADLAFDLRVQAEPTDPVLRLGRRFVPGLVSGRVRKRRDSIWLQLDPRLGTQGVPLHAPVVRGNAYVGRVVELQPERSRCRVDLVTGRNFFVGGVLAADRELRMTVGGLHGTVGPPCLAVHNPSERRFRSGLVLVQEPRLLANQAEHLADGYLLGRLRAEAEGPWSVEPVVDFKSGLFQLMVLVPKGAKRPPELDPVATLADGGWRATGPLSTGDSFRGRRSLRLAAGSLQGVEPGAAVVATTRLIGRVASHKPVAPLSASVLLIGDPGLELHVMARLDLDSRAEVLGRFVCLGMRAGKALFEWESLLGIEGGTAREELPEHIPATLYSGSGLDGLPEGLYIGRALLPTAPGTYVVTVEAFADGFSHRALWVRSGGPGAGR